MIESRKIMFNIKRNVVT